MDIAFGRHRASTGHLAFNEAQPELTPEQFAALGTRVLTLTPETKTANAIGDRGGAIAAMPNKAVTIGIKQILGARKVRLGVFREWHRAVVRQAAYGKVTAAFPVTLLQNHRTPPSIPMPSRQASPSERHAMGEKLLFTGGSVYVDGRFQQADLLVEDGRIAAIGQLNPAGLRVKNLGGRMLVPGFLDLHTHGGDGVDVNAATAQDFREDLPVLCPPRHHRLAVLHPHRHPGADPVVHRPGQGGHGGPGGRGPAAGHPPGGALPLHRVQGCYAGAPAAYRRRGAVSPVPASGGGRHPVYDRLPGGGGGGGAHRGAGWPSDYRHRHSGADYETAIRAIDAGAACCTHTFNAMGLFHQHRPGIMGAVLERPIYCEVICDGRHLHPGTVRMLLACKGWDKVVAITDSIQAAGLPDGHYKLGVNDVVVEDGDAKLASNGVRAGSTLTTGQALKNLVKFTGESVERVLPLLTANPARLVGLSYRKGSIAPGKDADLVVLDEELNVRETYVAGRLVYAGECE